MTSYLEVMKELRNGLSLLELSTKLDQLVSAVKETGKGGSITLTLKLKPIGDLSDLRQVMVDEEIKVKKPEKGRAPSMFFVSHENVMSREDERQPSLPGLRVLDMPNPGELKEVG